ncbi:blue-light-activated protein [Geobacter sp. OR-1]|uniref:hybrid sensor histidine kinase/response regulator n=1 Tax=Geobacter sp. OR-1 TaxID=1266765 RepID=UPI0005433125|nr:response regulator [Geobacter sp. OR-1]GAM10801.1 blue-light-activated protein [Geobacter sp. OR-1]
MNVLIVEDIPNARKLLRITFEHYGCAVIEAQDGVEGLEQATKHLPDIIVSDALMPRMDGFQLLRALKAEPRLKAIPFIFYSSTYTGEKEAELAFSLGADAFVAKPAEPQAVWEITCTVMKKWRARQEEPAAFAVINESDEQYLREYSRIVATKLEEKVHELETALTLRQQAEDELRHLNAELTREIGERKQAENALKEQEQELATIFENAPFVMLLLDEERKVRRVNALACSLTSSEVHEMVARKSGEALRCVRALDSAEGCGFGSICQGCIIRQTIMDTFKTGQSHHQVETTMPLLISGKETPKTFLFSTTKVTVSHQAMVLLSLQDVSEYKKLEAQLLHAQKMESIGTLAGGIAHDFNNILTAVIGYGDIALMNMGPEDPQRQNIEFMLAASHKAASLAKDLLLFSRKQISVKKNVDLNEMVRSMDKFLQRIIGEDIDCSISLDNEALPVFADEHQLEQVLMNLAANARDAMPNGGTLSIATERIRPDESPAGVEPGDAKAVLVVTDTGMGMDEETCMQIFDPFFTTKEVGKGTGLGLSVVYGIIKQHDGHVTVSSIPGQGTTFRVYLPLTSQPANKQNADLTNNKPIRGTETILLAEDDETVRNMALSVLRNFGYEVIVSVDGEDAVQKYLEHKGKIQLLLFDMIMPKKSGKEAYDEIIAHEPGIKVIFTSGYATDTVQRKAQVGDNGMMISKPYLPTNLLTTVRYLLNKRA